MISHISLLTQIALLTQVARYAVHKPACPQSNPLRCSRSIGRGQCAARATTEYTYTVDQFGTRHEFVTPRCDDHPITENVISTRPIEPPSCTCGLSALLASVREMGVEETPS